MEKKNMVLLTVIAVATLLVAVVGATFAYFTATVQDTRTPSESDGTANITAGSVASKTVVGNVENAAGKFEKTGVYPNHKEIAGLSVQVTNGEGQTGTTNTNIDIVYDVTKNTFAKDEIEVSVYKKEDSEADAITEDYFGCTHDVQQSGDENEYHFSETCAHEISELTSTAGLTKVTKEPVKLKGTTEEDLVIASDTISATGGSTSTTVYYYVVVEFKDTQQSQNTSMNAELTGKISVKAA